MEIQEIIANYVEKRDRKAEIVKRQSEEVKPLNEAMEQIENYILHQLNSLGVDSFKTSSGTAFKARQNSVQLQDAEAFKNFVFAPAAEAIHKHLVAGGYLPEGIPSTAFVPTFLNIIREMLPWDMIDFRAGKKGVVDYIENEKQQVPGIVLNTAITLNVRRA